MAEGLLIGGDLSKLDKQLDQIIKHSEDLDKRVTNAFKNISKEGARPLIEELKAVDNSLNSIFKKSSNVKNNPLANISKGASNAIDDVNKIVSAVNKIGDSKKADKGIANIDRRMSELFSKITKFQNEINLFKKLESGNLLKTEDYSHIKKVSEELDKLMRQYVALDNAKKRLTYGYSKTEDNNGVSFQQLKHNNEMKLLAEQIKAKDAAAKERIKLANKERAEDEKRYNAWLKQKHNEVLANEAAEAKKRAQNRATFREQQKEFERLKSQTYRGAIWSSFKADTIIQQKQAIKNLIAARERLSKTDSNYTHKLNRLNQEIARNQAEIDKARGKSGVLARAHRGLMDTTGQLQRKLALVFSISQIQGYVNQLISIRGEFELQQRSLQAILQSEGQANEIWNKTVQLAVRSPFRVKELVTYTKQLAAYRIETEKLYETNKMLADVSAGVGVSMDRLILAYGQVKSANYLRGTELRQFSEAGVNILKELADQFGEVEKRTVSVGEVFERVSKRLVTFEDVEKVFKRLTSEGGIFYNMQEAQAETLKGQISNLYDSIDLMFNEIGKKNDGLLKGSVSLTKSLIKNWEKVADAIKLVVASMITFKTYSLLVTLASQNQITVMRSLASANAAAAARTNLLSNAFKIASIKLRAFGVTVKSVLASAWPLLVAGIVVEGAMSIYSSISEVNEKLKEIEDEANKKKVKINELLNSYQKLKDLEKKNESSNLPKEEKEAKSKQIFDEKKKKLDDFIKYTKGLSVDIPINIKDVKKEDIDNVVEKLSNDIKYSLDVSTAFKENLEKSLNDVEWHGILGENLKTDLIQANKIAQEAFSGSSKLMVDNYYNNLLVNQDVLLKKSREYLDVIKEGRKRTQDDKGRIKYLETEEQFFVRKLDILREISKLEARERDFEIFSKYRNFLFDTSSFIFGGKEFKEVEAELRSVVENAFKNVDINKLTDNQKLLIKADIDRMVSEQNLEKWYEDYLKDFLYKEIHLNVKVDKTEFDDKFGEDWQKRLYDKLYSGVSKDGLTELGRNIKDLTIRFGEENFTGDKTFEQVVNTVKGLYEAEDKNKEIFETNKDNVKVTREEYELSMKRIPVLKELLSLLGQQTDKSSEFKKKEGEQLKLLKDRISAMKDAYNEYQKLIKSFNSTDSSKKILEGFSDRFKELGLDISKYDFSSMEGLLRALNTLADYASSLKGGKKELFKATSKVETEIGFENQKENEERFKKYLEETIGGYKAYIEIEDSGIPIELASLTGLDFIDPENFYYRIESLKDQAKDFGTDIQKYFEDKTDDFYKHLDDKNRERVKKYLQYVKEAMSERVKMNIEEIDEVDRINKLKLPDKTEEEIESSEKFRKYLLDNVKDKYKKKNDELQWKEFKDSDLYSYLFTDLSVLGNKSLDALNDKLKSLKDSLKDLPEDQVRAIVSEIEKIENIRIDRTPFEMLNKYRDEIRKGGKSYQEYQDEFLDANLKIEDYEKQLNYIETALAAKKEGKKLTKDLLEEASKYYDLNSMSVKELTEQGERLKNNIVQQKNISTDAKSGMDNYHKTDKAIKSCKESIGKYADGVKNVLGSIDLLLDAFGVAEDDSSRLWINNATQIANMIAQLFMLQLALKAMGLQANLALGVIGWVAIALQTVATLFAGLFGNKDKKKQKQIEAELRLVEDLERQYDKLGKAIEKAYEVNTLNKSLELSERNVRQQIEARYRMIELEEDRKKTDQDKIIQWRHEIEDLREAQEELRKEQVEKMGGNYDTRSAAREFLDSWLETFKETGDGLEGLENKFTEFARNIIAEQAVMRGLGKIIDPLMKQITDSLEDDYLISSPEWDAIEAKRKEVFEIANKYLKDFYEKFPGLFEENRDSLTGLQKGIQGITENTAEIIASYLNSIRFFVADTNSKISEYMKTLSSDNDGVNPMISYLKVISKQTTAIHTLLDSVTKNGHPSGGYGLKVFMD